jgi:hypothetical protein
MQLVMAVAAATWMMDALPARGNFIVNGSFEDYVYNSGNLPGWTSGDDQQLEVWDGPTYGVTGYDAVNVMEMAPDRNGIASQIVNISGGSYNLSLIYALREGFDPATCMLDVMWNGNLVAHLAPTSTAMVLYSSTVTAMTGDNTLELVGTGTDDGVGAIIDNVSLTAVPEPTTMIAGALLLLPLGASTLRLLRKRQTA